MWKTLTFDKTEKGAPSPIEFAFSSADGVLRNGQCGFGKVRYAEGSVYTGSLIYIDGQFEKYGFGEQDFTNSALTAADFDAVGDYKLYKFVGHYDYRVSNWIYGNGIVYFTDRLGAPKAFIKAFFSGTCAIEKWRGDFDTELLLPGYTPDLEIVPQRHEAQRIKLVDRVRGVSDCDTVLIGDSWFQFYIEPIASGMDGLFARHTAGKSVLNLGIGGSTFSEWVEYDYLSLLSRVKFKRVIINLGFNDIHMGMDPSVVSEFARRTIETVRAYNRDAEIFVLTVTPSMSFKRNLDKERELNAYLEVLAEEMRFSLLRSDELFMPNGKYRPDFDELFYSDGLHLSARGYDVWCELFRRYL